MPIPGKCQGNLSCIASWSIYAPLSLSSFPQFDPLPVLSTPFSFALFVNSFSSDLIALSISAVSVPTWLTSIYEIPSVEALLESIIWIQLRLMVVPFVNCSQCDGYRVASWKLLIFCMQRSKFSLRILPPKGCLNTYSWQ